MRSFPWEVHQKVRRSLKFDRNEPIVSGLPRTASQAMPEIFFTLALFIQEQVDPSATLVYARIAEALNPQSAEIKLFVADVLEEWISNLALRVYEKMEPKTPNTVRPRLSCRCDADQTVLMMALMPNNLPRLSRCPSRMRHWAIFAAPRTL